MLRQPASGRVAIDVVDGKTLMMGRKVSPEVSLRPRKKGIGVAAFYIKRFLTSGYRECMATELRCEVQTVKSTAARNG